MPATNRRDYLGEIIAAALATDRTGIAFTQGDEPPQGTPLAGSWKLAPEAFDDDPRSESADDQLCSAEGYVTVAFTCAVSAIDSTTNQKINRVQRALEKYQHPGSFTHPTDSEKIWPGDPRTGYPFNVTEVTLRHTREQGIGRVYFHYTLTYRREK